MNKFEFKLPDVGEGVTEGEIVKWLVKPGDAVGEDQPIVEVMTDKATVTITSPKSGTIQELGGAEGSVVAVGKMLVLLSLGDGAPSRADAAQGTNGGAGGAGPQAGIGSQAGAAAAAPKSEGPAATAVGDIRESLPGMDLVQPSTPRAAAIEAPRGAYFNAKPLATPATRKFARDIGVDLRAVAPSGPHGRVMKEDIRRAAAPASVEGAPAPLAASAAPAGAAATGLQRVPIVVAPPIAGQESLEERRPLKGVRRRIFDAMSRSKHTAAHFTFVEECDVSALKGVRERLRPLADQRKVKLTYLPFFVKAVVAALKRHPLLNSAFDESTQEIVERRYYNIGIASATEQGLMVPVVHGADKKSLLEIAADIQRLGEATKSGKVAPEDLRGSTFTITSLGAQGGLFATPILNLPEVGILGLHQMKQKPVVRDGQIVIGDVMLLSLSFDHRLIDGHIGAAFAYELIAYLENPDRLWLEMS